jgi:hypothetical protein
LTRWEAKLCVKALGKLQGAELFGTASPGKHDALRQLGAVPFDYSNEAWIGAMHIMEEEATVNEWMALTARTLLEAMQRLAAQFAKSLRFSPKPVRTGPSAPSSGAGTWPRSLIPT